MPWLADELPQSNEYLQQDIYTVSSYNKLTADGIPSLTMFCNLPAISIKAIKLKWADSIRAFSHGIPYGLHDHYTLFGLALSRLQSELKVYELQQGFYVSLNLV
jgi:hypothetical protein